MSGDQPQIVVVGQVARDLVLRIDEVGHTMREQARSDGIAVTNVVVRSQTSTALSVDIIDGDAHWRYLEECRLRRCGAQHERPREPVRRSRRCVTL